MKRINKIFLVLVVTIVFPFLLASECSVKQNIFIRTNQLGFLPADIKTAVIISDADLSESKIQLINTGSLKEIAIKKPGKSLGEFEKFGYTYSFDFSEVKTPGTYRIQIGDTKSHDFKIAQNIYNEVVDSLMEFFKIQRCGYTNPEYHDVCHKYDATSLIKNGEVINKKYDVTGGWHDAADYVKFLNTTAFTTYTLLFSYDFDNEKYGFDNNNNGVPDIIEEAKIGLDWMMRAAYDDKNFITQVQDLRDHEVGWRLPENDSKETDRPAFIGTGKNLIGIYSATLALAYRIWNEKYNFDNFAEKCLTTAENYYAVKDEVMDIDTSGTDHYRDSEYKGKLALAAVEMYLSTRNQKYYNDAIRYAKEAGSDFWWSWGNINSYAHYRLASIDLSFAEYIKNSLIMFSENSSKNLFSEGTAIRWGSNHTLLGVALQSILYEKITGKNDFRKLAVTHRDYILGRNQWGVSFISDIGKVSSRNLHHQISYLKTKRLPGGFAAGPVSKEYIDGMKIPFEKEDKFSDFQSESAYYRDDRMDYITNEPTISANATAIFVMGFYNQRKK